MVFEQKWFAEKKMYLVDNRKWEKSETNFNEKRFFGRIVRAESDVVRQNNGDGNYVGVFILANNVGRAFFRRRRLLTGHVAPLTGRRSARGRGDLVSTAGFAHHKCVFRE